MRPLASDLTTLLLWSGIIGAVGFVAAFAVDGATRPGYDWRRHPVSALALGPRGWLQTGNFVVAGVLIGAGAVGVRSATGTVVLPLAVAVFALALVLSGVFPMDAMRGYPPGTGEGDPADFSARHHAHDLAGAVVFASVPLIALAAAFTLTSTSWRMVGAVVAAVTAALTVAFGAAWEADRAWAGGIQRAAIVAGWSWLAALQVHLLP